MLGRSCVGSNCTCWRREASLATTSVKRKKIACAEWVEMDLDEAWHGDFETKPYMAKKSNQEKRSNYATVIEA